MRTTTKSITSYPCRNHGCHNRYTDVVGLSKRKAGAECLPCLYAGQMVAEGRAIEQVEKITHLMAMFTRVLAEGGWTWQNVKDSYDRIAGKAWVI